MTIYAADFETTTDPNDCRVWAWGLADIEDADHVLMGTDISSFLDRIFGEIGTIIYFHNLAFDGRFIIDALMRHGWNWVNKQARYLNSGEFTTLISDRGKVYSINIMGSQSEIEFRDSLKILPMSIATVAKSFNLPILKGEIDYDVERPVGHQLTSIERNYLHNDVSILGQALKIELDQGLNKLTAGANAFNAYRKIMGKSFKHMFPVLSNDIDAYVRQAYRGGFTYCNPKFANQDVGPGISLDFNSMYPSMMISKNFPVGKPEWFGGKYIKNEEFPLYIQEITCEFMLKPDGIPMVQLKGNWYYAAHTYVEESIEPTNIKLTDIDLELFLENYDVDILSYNGGYMFRSMAGMFDEYIAQWRRIKESSQGGIRQIAKLMLNSLYGKFGTNIDVTPKVPVFDDDRVKLVIGDYEERESVYCPVAVWVTAYARDTLIRAVMAVKDRFLYCDTDSMHLLGTNVPNLPIDDTKFGCWKVEGEFTRARHIRAKCYMWDLNDKIEVKCAGMPNNIKEMVTWDNFHIGFNNLKNGKVIPGRGKLIPKSVPGGIVLEPRPYQLR